MSERHKHLRENAIHKKVNIILTMQRQNDIISMLLEGKDVKEICKYVVDKYRVKYNSAKTYIYECKDIIKQREKCEIQNLISLHLLRYEEMYKSLYELGMWRDAQNCLKAKEKLMGFHREGFHMKVTQGEIHEISRIQVDNEYDFMKLSDEKLKRLNELAEIAKRDYSR